jgi:putative transposase
MWGTDLTTTITGEGQAAVFIAVDHCSAECVGIHAARPATRIEALEPLRQGVREHFGGFAKDGARGLSARHDHGSQYMSDVFQKEHEFLVSRVPLLSCEHPRGMAAASDSSEP